LQKARSKSGYHPSWSSGEITHPVRLFPKAKN